jgi:hypothetical protein
LCIVWYSTEYNKTVPPWHSTKQIIAVAPLCMWHLESYLMGIWVTEFNCNWFLMMPSIRTKFQYVNSPFLFSFSLTTCFGPYGPSSGEIYN